MELLQLNDKHRLKVPKRVKRERAADEWLFQYENQSIREPEKTSYSPG